MKQTNIWPQHAVQCMLLLKWFIKIKGTLTRDGGRSKSFGAHNSNKLSINLLSVCRLSLYIPFFGGEGGRGGTCHYYPLPLTQLRRPCLIVFLLIHAQLSMFTNSSILWLPEYITGLSEPSTHAFPPQILIDQLVSLSQENNAHLNTTWPLPPPDFQTFLRPCIILTA